MQQQSALLALPPELRNHIYELTLLKYEDIDVKAAIGGNPTRPPALLQASQQLRCEATPMYYGSNTFAIIGRKRTAPCADGDDALRTWLSALDAYARSCLRTIRLGKDAYFMTCPAAGDKRLLACRRKLSEAQIEIDGAKLLVRAQDNELEGRVWQSG